VREDIMSRRLLQPAGGEKNGRQRLIRWKRPELTASARFGRVIPVCEPLLNGNERRYVDECLETNWISSKGRFIERFEAGFADACDVGHGISCTSGTAALHLLLHAMDVGAGDEVIVPASSIIATANTVRLTGARPVFVDSEPRSFGIDPANAAERITARTKAIVAVHLYGHPCDMDALRAIAEQHDLWLVEDAAQAFGASLHGRRAGGLGHAAAFSLYANKLITTGEGGMIVTDDDLLAALLRSLRDQAFSPETHFWHHYLGFNYRMTNLQAAIGLAQLEQAEDLVEARIAHAARYDAGLRDLPGIRLPARTDRVRNVFWMYAILVDDAFGMDRDALMAALGAAGIESKTFFIPMHLQPIYYDAADNEAFPVAEDIAVRGLYLPSSSGLRDEEIDYVVEVMRDLSREASCR